MADTQAIGIGFSRADDPVAAAEEVCATALDGRIPGANDLMVLFATVEYDPRELFAAARGTVAPAHLAGCSSFSSFTNTTLVRRGVVGAFLPGEDLTFGVAGVDPISGHIYSSARDVTQLALDRAGGEG